MSGAGAGSFPHTSAFDGYVQDTDGDTDLWEGIDAVIICAGRGDGMCVMEASGAGGSSTGARHIEDLVRFVSHKCVLHGKPLVWGWAGGGGNGGGGVEVSKVLNLDGISELCVCAADLGTRVNTATLCRVKVHHALS